MDKLVFLEDDKCVIWATEDVRDSCRGWVVLTDCRVGRGAIGITEDQMLEAFALYRKHTGQPEPSNKTWIPFDPTNPPPPGDYWCEVPALTLRDGGCLCRALYWTGERWDGPGGEYEVGRFVPEMLPQLHGRGVAREMTDDGDDWKLASALERIGDLESERDAAIAREKRASKLFELVSAERNELVRSVNLWIARAMEAEQERDSMAIRIDRLSAELAKPEDQRLRDVLDALEGRAVIFDGLGARVGHLLDEMDEWIARAGEAERMVEAARRSLSSVAEAMTEHAYQELASALESPPRIAVVVPVEVRKHGWQWRPTATDTAFAPPFGTIRQCRVCGCLVAGGPTACARCAEAGS